MRMSRLAVVLLSGLAALLLPADPARAATVELKPAGATEPVTLEIQVEGEASPRTVTTDRATGTARIEVDAGKRITVTPRGNHQGSPVTLTVHATGTTVAIPVQPTTAARQPGPGSGARGPDPARPFIQGYFDAGAWMVQPGKRSNYGTRIPGGAGSEQAIAKSDDTLTGPSLGLGLDVPVTREGTIVIRGSYQFAEGKSTGSVPVGGQFVANTYFDLFNNFSGVALLATGADVRIDTKVTQFDFDAVYQHRFPLTPELQLMAGLGIGYRRFTAWHEAEQTSPTFAGISSSAELDSEAHLVGAMFTGGVEWRPMKWLSFGVGGFLLPGWGYGTGTAEQRNLCNLCQASLQDVRIRIEDDDSDFALAGGVTGQIGFSVTDRLQIGLMGGWQRKKTYDWDVPTSPLERPAKFQRHGTDEVKVGVNLRFTF